MRCPLSFSLQTFRSWVLLRVVGHPQKSGLRKADLYFGNAQLFGYLFKCKIESGEIVLWMIHHFSYITKFEKKFTIYRVEENGPSTTATNCLFVWVVLRCILTNAKRQKTVDNKCRGKFETFVLSTTLYRIYIYR
jgi:hypothetical protein